MFLGYAVLGILAGLFVQALVAETKDRSQEEIEADLQRTSGRKPRRHGPSERTLVSR